MDCTIFKMADSRNGKRNIGNEIRNSQYTIKQESFQRLVGSYQKNLEHNWKRLSWPKMQQVEFQ